MEIEASESGAPTFHAIDALNADACISLAKTLLQDGKSRFLLWGRTNTAEIVKHALVKAGNEHPRLAVAFCDRKGGDGALLPEEAKKFSADVVFVFSVTSSNAILNEILRLELEPQDIVYMPQENRKVVIVSLMKGGTHLILELMRLLGFRRTEFTDHLCARQVEDLEPGTFVVVHSFGPPSDYLFPMVDDGTLSVLFNIRHPYACAVSFVKYFSDPRFCDVIEQSGDRAKQWHTTYSALPSHAEGLDRFFTTGGRIDDFLENAPLLFNDAVTKIRYENLVGPMGGGDAKTQVVEIEKVLSALGLDLPPSLFSRLIYNKNSLTFNVGSANDYRTYFTDHLLEQAGKAYPGICELYGYPQSEPSSR